MGLFNWLREYRRHRERCTWCGWYLHPQLVFKSVKRPTFATYGKIGEDFVCNHCYEIHKNRKI